MHPADVGTAHQPVRSQLCPVDLVPRSPEELTRETAVSTTRDGRSPLLARRTRSPHTRASCPTRPTAVTSPSRARSAAS